MDKARHGKKTAPKLIEATERARQAMDLRAGGATYEQIAKVLGYSDRAAAYNAVNRHIRAAVVESAGLVRETTRERLSVLLLSVWAKAKDPNNPKQLAFNQRAHNLVLDIAKLYGVDPNEVVKEAQPQGVMVIGGDPETFVKAMRALRGDPAPLPSSESGRSDPGAVSTDVVDVVEVRNVSDEPSDTHADTEVPIPLPNDTKNGAV